MMRILLVEDERDLAEPIIELLRRELYEIVWADTYDSACRALDKPEYDLAILDVMLPGHENAGLELAQTLCHAGFSGRILFLTARDSLEDRIRSLNIGGDDYMIKPFSLYELLARVGVLLGRSTKTRQAGFVLGGHLLAES